MEKKLFLGSIMMAVASCLHDPNDGSSCDADPATRKLSPSDADITDECKKDEKLSDPTETKSLPTVLSGHFGDTARRGNKPDADWVKVFTNRTTMHAANNADDKGNVQLWTGMSDSSYTGMVKAVLDKADVPPGGVVVESGAGVGKLLALAICRHKLRAIGFEPALNSVCAGKLIFGDIFATSPGGSLHKGGANDLSLVPTSTADLALTLGVLCYFPDITYLCLALAEQLRVLKPGGVVMHVWVLDDPQNWGTDKLNIKKEFWGNSSTGPLPACANTISMQVNLSTLEIEEGCAWCGLGHGYSVYMRKVSGAV